MRNVYRNRQEEGYALGYIVLEMERIEATQSDAWSMALAIGL